MRSAETNSHAKHCTGPATERTAAGAAKKDGFLNKVFRINLGSGSNAHGNHGGTTAAAPTHVRSNSAGPTVHDTHATNDHTNTGASLATNAPSGHIGVVATASSHHAHAASEPAHGTVSSATNAKKPNNIELSSIAVHGHGHATAATATPTPSTFVTTSAPHHGAPGSSSPPPANGGHHINPILPGVVVGDAPVPTTHAAHGTHGHAPTTHAHLPPVTLHAHGHGVTHAKKPSTTHALPPPSSL